MDAAGPSGLTRRAWTRLTIWGAVGLSLFPGCRPKPKAARPQPVCYELASPLPAKPTLLERWGELGRLWREMGQHYRAQGEGPGAGPSVFADLRQELKEALDAVDASEDLRLAFEARWKNR